MATQEQAAWDPGAEDDWFGDGTAFKTEEELAAALFSLAGTLGLDGAPHPQEASPFRLEDDTVPVIAVEHPPLVDGSRRNGNGNGTLPAAGAPTSAADEFEIVDALEPAPDTLGPMPLRVAPASPPAPAPLSWSVRPPGGETLPPRQPGRTGWSIRNSVKLLQHIDLTLQRLREEAVLTALSAASRALHDLPDRHSAAAAAASRSASRRRISV